MLIAISVDMKEGRKIGELNAKMHLDMHNPSESVRDAAKAEKNVKLRID